MSHHPTGLNGHPIVEELCQFLESHLCKVSHYLAFLVDRYEELMKANASNSQEYLAKADQVNISIFVYKLQLSLINSAYFFTAFRITSR